jgi:hypothetical protein
VDDTATDAGCSHHHGPECIFVHKPPVLEEDGAQMVFADAVAFKVNLHRKGGVKQDARLGNVDLSLFSPSISTFISI